MTIEVNPAVARLSAYVPGEQPQETGWIKLNTNEFPYPPAPEVTGAMQEFAARASFAKYPDPSSTALRNAVAHSLEVAPEQVLAGNGSDEVLRLICHAFLREQKLDSIGMLFPTYTLYKTLAEMFGCAAQVFPTVPPKLEIPNAAVDANLKIFFLANPNPPLGTLYSLEDVASLASARPDRIVVVDEAYVDFSCEGGSSVALLSRFPNLLVTRTFSKSYGLAGMRVGFVVGATALIDQMTKIRDSYNLNLASQAVAVAAWKAGGYYHKHCAYVCRDREYLAEQLRNRGFVVPQSSGNFIFARRADAKEVFAGLRKKKVLVRYFDAEALRDGLRITIGTRSELDVLLAAIDSL